MTVTNGLEPVDYKPERHLHHTGSLLTDDTDNFCFAFFVSGASLVFSPFKMSKS